MKMASTKESVVIIMDVGESMSRQPSKLEGAIKAVAQLIQQKILFSPKDEVTVILFGTKETNNQLEGDGYVNIVVMRETGPPDVDLLRDLEILEPQGEVGDFIDALIVGMDILIKKVDGKAEKKIFIITDGGCPVNEDGIDKVLEQFKKIEAKLNVIGVDFSETGDMKKSSNRSKTAEKNEQLLRDMCSQIDGTVHTITDALEIMSEFRKKTVKATTTFRGTLDIGDDIKIHVRSYLKVSEAKLPSMKKLSKVAEESKEPGTLAVVAESTYHPVNNMDESIEKDQRVKGYKYGRTIVPFTPIIEQDLKLTGERVLLCLGFTKRSRIMHQHYMDKPHVFTAEPGYATAYTAFSALVRAMAETDLVAIVRFVRQKNAQPILGCLVPKISPNYDYCLFHRLPFAEDLRNYPFPSLDPAKMRKGAPNAEQLITAQKLIDSLDLMEAAVDEDGDHFEALNPKYTFNPVLQRFYQCIQTRAMKAGAPIPKLDPKIDKYLNPDKELFDKAAGALKQFKEKFPLKRAATRDKEQRVFWKDAFANTDVNLDTYMGDAAKKRRVDEENISLDALVSSTTNQIGSINPVKDFQSMLARRDVDVVDLAIKGMEDRIIQMVTSSIGNELYEKALNCLEVLRESCIKEEEGASFNEFMHKLKSMFADKRHDDFWQKIVEKGISVIHQEEWEDSEFSEKQSKEFLKAKEKPAPVSQPQPDNEIDDLLDEIE